jgi:hypothetical protein
MSPHAWIRRQRDRPIAEHERRWAFTAIAAAMVATTLLLALTAPDGPSTPTAATPGNRGPHQQASQAPEDRSAPAALLTSAGERAARLFLHGYLRYLYGHDRASEIRGATVAFTRSLPARAPHLSPAMRAEHARVVSLQAAPAPAGLIGVTVLVNDGGLIDYPIALRLARQDRLLLVSRLGGA